MVTVSLSEFDFGIGYIFDLIERSARSCQLECMVWAEAMTFSWLDLCDMSLPGDIFDPRYWSRDIFSVHEEWDCLLRLVISIRKRQFQG